MVQELRVRNQAQQLYVRALSAAWRNQIMVHDPSLWLLRDPEAEEKMLRDIDIAHAVGFRCEMVAGPEWSVTPRRKASPRAPLACAVATELLEEIDQFTNARELLGRAFFHGSRFAYIHGEYRKLTLGDGRQRVWWVPVRLEDRDKRWYRKVSELDEKADELTAHWEQWHLVRQEWEEVPATDAVNVVRHVYQDEQGTLGHGRALREALGWIWYAKTNLFQEALQSAEKHAGGTLVAKVDGARDADTGKPNSTLIQDWRDLLEDMRSRHVLVHDAADQIEVLPTNADGHQIFQMLLDQMRSSVFTLVLGANLTTSADKGGSYALAEIQENTTEARIQKDRRALEETLTKNLLTAVWFHNHRNMYELGLTAEMPRFTITQEKRQDPEVRARVAATLNQIGVALSADDLYEQTGFRKPEEGEELVEGKQEIPQASPFGGFGPLQPEREALS